MVKFDTLNIDNGVLTVAASIRSGISGVTLNKIKIKSSELENGNYKVLCEKTCSGTTASYSLTSADLGYTNVDSNIFIVEVTTTGEPTVEQPCGKNKTSINSAVYNKCVAYNDILSAAKELNVECEIPKNLIDAILRFKLMECCIATGRTVEAVNYYAKLYSTLSKKVSTRRCGCNGSSL